MYKTSRLEAAPSAHWIRLHCNGKMAFTSMGGSQSEIREICALAIQARRGPGIAPRPVHQDAVASRALIIPNPTTARW